MPNAKTQRQGPNATYIPPAGVGVLRRERRKFIFVCVGRDTNILVSQRKILASGVIAQSQPPTPEFCIAVEYRLNLKEHITQ